MATTKYKYLVFPVNLMKKCFMAREKTFREMMRYGIGHEAWQIRKKKQLTFEQHFMGTLYSYKKGTRLPEAIRETFDELEYAGDGHLEIEWVDGMPSFDDTVITFTEKQFSILNSIRNNLSDRLIEYNSFNVALNNLYMESPNVVSVMDEYHNLFSLYEGSPTPSMPKSALFGFRDGNKSEFELVCFCVCAGLKSMLGSKPFIKTNKEAVMNRSIVLGEENVDIAARYSTRRLWDKVVAHLTEHWGLKYYSSYTRGFYVSFKMSIEDLAYKAETMKDKAKIEKMKQQQTEARKKALERIKAGY